MLKDVPIGVTLAFGAALLALRAAPMFVAFDLFEATNECRSVVMDSLDEARIQEAITGAQCQEAVSKAKAGEAVLDAMYSH